MKIFNLKFSGVYTNQTLNNLPEKSGIYCVFKGEMKPNNTIIPVKLIYIGQAKNLPERLNASRVDDEGWEDKLGGNEILYYKYAEVEEKDLDIVEAAMIYHHKPEGNIQCVDNFPYDEEVLITISDGRALLDRVFFVRREIQGSFI